ncbi:hypothetical protein TPHA_0G00700 [Tetrapisispora phaffii CBS 4417]|uniref:Mevalonate kinase n=1 Tax=Tetrapisispora phaffii (strain ATCC 24235 / CBS 4417 / NBRC 1672 / NRRL Y-8282 / UCD 70-5) TaxID=1071381 RepID=G8BVH8_TETPH|nr:hypothetical protein TPHA_0G00700 [Tetrapisispora phaffii CBS 4417]CCE63906.1 hypothetical protein TPHA_0G00700 [Tetrapisispora phaffii CBS 4417]
MSFITSAPGKVIIFGEHSAVYNEPAVAASVSSLRAYTLVERLPGKSSIALNFPDIDFSHEWSHQEIDKLLNSEHGKKLISVAQGDTKNLNQELVDLLDADLLSNLKDSFHYHAAFCFLYLYICLCPSVTGVAFSVKSTLPIGAGLGSSASISVCLALAMLKLGGSITSADCLTENDKKLVNSWSFIGETCIHGTPSGIDNAVATYGNAVLFKREEDGSTDFKFLEFPQIPMILSYTKIPRTTKVLVNNVRELFNTFPDIVKPILGAMGNLALIGTALLEHLSENGEENYSKLLQLIRVNHGLLVSLGVSHPGLETIKSLSDTLGIGETKLTGAGGGGCSLTILKHGIQRKEIDDFKSTLETQYCYGTYETDLGGMGCSFVNVSDIAPNDADLIRNVFTNTESSREEIDNALLPSTSNITWIC